jgi:hypothetical protein
MHLCIMIILYSGCKLIIYFRWYYAMFPIVMIISFSLIIGGVQLQPMFKKINWQINF